MQLGAAAVALEKHERFSGGSCLQVGDRFLELRCVLNTHDRCIQGVPTRAEGYVGRFENLSFLEARKALFTREPLRLTLENGSRFRVALIDRDGSFTAEPVE